MYKLFSKLALSAALLLAPTSLLAADVEQNVDQTSESYNSSVWVWAEKQGTQHAVMLSRSGNDGWQEPEKISDNDAVNVVPAVSRLPEGGLVVVWSAFKNGQSKLIFTHEEDGEWGDEAVIYTGLVSNTAPSVAVDSNGTTWLVWAGFNGLSDEIYYSTWDGSEFSTPTPITDNSVPDILPVVGLDTTNGLPWIQWQQYTPTGYRDYQTYWSEGEWSEPLEVPMVNDVEETDSDSQIQKRNAQVKVTAATADHNEETPAEEVAQIEEIEIEIPEFVTEPDSASIHLPGNEIQSLPVRSMTLVE